MNSDLICVHLRESAAKIVLDKYSPVVSLFTKAQKMHISFVAINLHGVDVLHSGAGEVCHERQA